MTVPKGHHVYTFIPRLHCHMKPGQPGSSTARHASHCQCKRDKACRAKPVPSQNRAGPAHFLKVSWHGTSTARHWLACQCKRYRAESVPCQLQCMLSSVVKGACIRTHSKQGNYTASPHKSNSPSVLGATETMLLPQERRRYQHRCSSNILPLDLQRR